MKLNARSAAFALAVGMLVALPGAANAGCKQIAAVGTGVTQDLAKFMADAALKNIRENQGAKPSGATTYKCEPGMIATDCHARQKVCS